MTQKSKKFRRRAAKWEGPATAVALAAAAAVGASTSLLMFAIAFLVMAAALAYMVWPLARYQPTAEDRPAPPGPVGVVVDFLSAWRFCPLASSPNASQADLEDAAKQLLDALTETDGRPPDRMQARLDQLYADMLLLRRFQLFPVEWLTLADAQKWMGVTESEAERALGSLCKSGKIAPERGQRARWSLCTEARAEAIENPPVRMPG